MNKVSKVDLVLPWDLEVSSSQGLCFDSSGINFGRLV